MRSSLIAILALTAICVSSITLAQAPDSLSFQGRLADLTGAALDTTVGMTFKLYKDGSAVWTEAHPSVVVTGGIFNVLLGGTTPLDTMAFNAPLKLGITVGTDAEISPRTPLAAAAYAKALPGMYAFYRDDGFFESYNVVGGAANNVVGAGVVGATISGGGGMILSTPVPNSVLDDFGTVGGGQFNTASGGFATVGGGTSNTASGAEAAVPGGSGNVAGGRTSFAAGNKARAIHDGTFVWNDRSITSGNDSLLSTGPNQFLIRADGGVGIGTDSPSSPLTVAGFVESTADGFKFPDGTTQSTAAGASSTWSLVGNVGTTAGTNFIGTTDNQAFEIKTDSQRVFRFEPETDISGPNLIGGYSGNIIGSGLVGATIAGGGDPTHGINGIEDDYSFIGGGTLNTAGGPWATIGGGDSNESLGRWATIGGGKSNTASGDSSTVGGGAHNSANLVGATIGGGSGNMASGRYSTVPGGFGNIAAGQATIAMGTKANANHGGSFVWQDSTGGNGPNYDLNTGSGNQFLARASGGFFFFTDAAPNLTIGISLPAGSGTWTALSSKSSKTNFNNIDAQSYLDRVASLELKEWSYKTEEGVTHVGPMAEDFHAAFGHGPTDKGISGVDADGVALAAIQGLYELVQELQAEVKELRAELR